MSSFLRGCLAGIILLVLTSQVSVLKMRRVCVFIWTIEHLLLQFKSFSQEQRRSLHGLVILHVHRKKMYISVRLLPVVDLAFGLCAF